MIEELQRENAHIREGHAELYGYLKRLVDARGKAAEIVESDEFKALMVAPDEREI